MDIRFGIQVRRWWDQAVALLIGAVMGAVMGAAVTAYHNLFPTDTVVWWTEKIASSGVHPTQQLVSTRVMNTSNQAIASVEVHIPVDRAKVRAFAVGYRSRRDLKGACEFEDNDFVVKNVEISAHNTLIISLVADNDAKWEEPTVSVADGLAREVPVHDVDMMDNRFSIKQLIFLIVISSVASAVLALVAGRTFRNVHTNQVEAESGSAAP